MISEVEGSDDKDWCMGKVESLSYFAVAVAMTCIYIYIYLYIHVLE